MRVETGMYMPEPDRPRCRARMGALAALLAPHRARFEQLAEAQRRRVHIEALIMALQEELSSQDEQIRKQTIELYDQLVVDLVDAGR